MNLFDRAAIWAKEQGAAALAEHDLTSAAGLFAYASRHHPNDLDLALRLGSLQLRQGDPASGETFRRLAETHDIREGWFGLAAVAMQRAACDEAAEFLARGLSHHAPLRSAGFAAFCHRIAQRSRAPGWCGLTADGVLNVSVCPGPPKLCLDGQPTHIQPIAVGGILRYRLRNQLLGCQTLTVCYDGQHLLGSPIAVTRLVSVEGFVDAWDGGLAGWVWLPGDPDYVPNIFLRCGSGWTGRSPVLVRRACPPDVNAKDRRWRFTITAGALRAFPGPIIVTGPGESPLLGSPLDPKLTTPTPFSAMDDPHDRSSPKRGNRFGKRRGVGVIIPVYRGCAETFACLASVLESIPDQASVVVVDDASPETQLVTGLDAFARDGRIRLICHRQNRGFPAAVNAGIRAASGQDIVLLNSDTLVANNWVERLQRAAFSAPDIGTVTPFTNDGSLVSYPSAWQANPAPDGRALRNLDQLAYRANGDTVFDLPTGVGFCMYIRRDCLDAVGLFREDVFAQGYGEENDFCLRAKNLGWRHVAAPGVFVSHLAARSFAGRTDGAAAHLRSRNLSRLNQLHFGYDALIAAFAQEDPLAKARHALDEQRFRKAQSDDTSNDTSSRSSALLITHSRGGGVQRRVRERCAEWQASGVRAVVLSPTSNGACTVSDFGEVYPNLIFSIPQQFGELLELLCATKPVCVELHHFLGHHPHLLKLADCLKIPLDIVVHDYAWFCPQITLTGTDHRYCGEPEINVCENCTSDLGGEISPGALRERSHQLFSAARRVVVPSRDTARRLERHFPAVMPEICPWESDTPAPPAPRPRTRPKLRICVAGALGAHKGYDTLLALGRDVAARRLPIEYVLVGYSHDDLPLLETRAISVTGRFQAGECAGLLARQQSDLGFLPSGIPETWSYTLSEMWEAGLLVAAFDIGAPAERIRTTGRGLLLPLGLPGERINEVFLHWWRSTTGR